MAPSMSCFRSPSPPLSPNDSSPAPLPSERRRSRKNGSLTSILGSIGSTPPRSPSSKSSFSSRGSSWLIGRRPPISPPFSSEDRVWSSTSTPDRSTTSKTSLSTPTSTPPTSFDSRDTTTSEKMAAAQFLNPAAAATAGGRLKQMREAKEMEKAVQAKAKRIGNPVPPYNLLELIGKGSFGRVFKSRRQHDNEVVAVKIIDVDNSDYKMDASEKDQAIKDFVNEIKVLHTLKDSQAKNINLIHEAFPFHSQLWIVSDYCPGGSVHTLMKASNPPGLEEKFIIVIARELAVALKHVHEAGIIHRDVKAANILITQDGQLQLCDFGVSGILESKVAKRSTIIGTPFWMAPEMHEADALSTGYGTEIDCWAFGCTMYELATGLPPNARIAPHKLHLFLKKAPRLEGDEYSDDLRQFVSFCLEERPENRPSSQGILKHPFVTNSAKKYPTAILRQLIERYAQWEQAGGQRTSLFNAYGAKGPTADLQEEDDSWNFSTTDDFARDLLKRFESPEGSSSTELEEATPKQSMSVLDKAKHEERIMRGEKKMGRLFDMSTEPYGYGYTRRGSEPLTDLPLRSLHSNSANRETIIDLDAAQDLSAASLDLADVPTIRANKANRFYEDDDDEEITESTPPEFWSQRNNLEKRLTKDWKYPAPMTMPERENARPRTQDWTFPKLQKDVDFESQSADEAMVPASSSNKLAPPFRPTLKHTKTEPVGNFGDFVHPADTLGLSSEPPDRDSMIDIDDLYLSSTSESAHTDVTSGDPFDLEPDINNTVRQRASQHTHAQSAPSYDSSLDTHLRNGSISSDSDFERIHKPGSVQDSASFLRRASNADENWENEVEDIHRRSDHVYRRADDPPFTATGINPNWAFDSPTLGRDSDLSGFSPESHRAAPPANPSSSSSARAPRGRRTRVSRTHHHHHHQQHAPRRGDSDDSAVVYFPEPGPPEPAALEEDADPSAVVAELERLLDDYLAGLKAAGGFLGGTRWGEMTSSSADESVGLE